MPTSIKNILKCKPGYKVTGSLWMEFEGERFFGPGRVELLQLIEETGSLNKAAQQMGMSYKKAWEMVTALNTQAARPLVLLQAGGKKGGGSSITEEAKTLIAYHASLRERFNAFLEKETQNLQP